MEKISRDEFEEKLKGKVSPEKIHLIMLAYRLSKSGHRNQKRDNGERYFEHPKRVTLILMDELNIFDPKVLIAALLHDIKEDAFILTWEDIEFIFGKRICKMVRDLTKDTALEKNQRDEKYRKQIEASSRRVKIIKLADRLDNLRDLSTASWFEERRNAYINETILIYLPLAKKVSRALFQKLKELC